MNIRRFRWRSLAAAAGVACLALTAAACSGSPSSSSTPSTSAPAPASAPANGSATPSGGATGQGGSIPVGLTGTAKTIATNWVTFFNPSTPVATKVSLLENGSTFSTVLQGQATSSTAQSLAAQVTAVTVTSSTAATVTWNLLLNGAPALTNQKGAAVYQGGVWKVASTSFCGLLALNAASSPVPAACKS